MTGVPTGTHDSAPPRAAGSVATDQALEHVLCAVCDVDDAAPYKEENGFQAVQCRRCGLVYVNPRPTIEQMKHLYDGQETHVHVGQHIGAVDEKRVQARHALRLLARHRRSGRVLEIGSAAGYFLEQAAELGYDVQGLDITHDFVEYSSRVLGIPTAEGTLQNAPFADHSFDIIYFRNVLSHLAFPHAEFSCMHRLLAPGGVLLFETGNVAELPAEEAGVLELPDHLYHWSQRTIESLLERTGFTPVETHRYTLVMQLPAVRRLSGWMRRRRTGNGTGTAAPRPRTHEIPAAVPRSSLGKRVQAHWGNMLRYGVGAAWPGAGRRCTLIVLAEKR